MAGLEQYRLKVTPESKFIVSSKLPGGMVHIDHLTDALAALLIGDGISHYVEKIKVEQQTETKRGKTNKKPASK
ncbi:hypothetical protein D770_20280 [Flammeovirgaceae bacterium 311]|nr:hypothetical protein D770_20280 [Flammeovirgaceae bacterium 311]